MSGCREFPIQELSSRADSTFAILRRQNYGVLVIGSTISYYKDVEMLGQVGRSGSLFEGRGSRDVDLSRGEEAGATGASKLALLS